MKTKQITKLKELYSAQSKHSNYQVLPKQLLDLLKDDQIEIKTRYEAERLKCIVDNIDIEGKSILDIGGNTGYFSFELLNLGAKSIHYYEGNKIHADFVGIAADLLGVKNKMEISNKYYTFNNEMDCRYDIILLLNVLHHLGDDFGPKEISMERAKQDMIVQLNHLSTKTDILVFQMGFNWKGDRNAGLFEDGTKKAMLDYLFKGAKGYWTIENIGVPEPYRNGIQYSNLNSENIDRNDSIGEFLNRPLIILKSLK